MGVLKLRHYHNNEFSSVKTLHNVKSYVRSRMSEQSSVSVHFVYSVSVEKNLIRMCEV